ncbi:low molecular weight protein-tyrosine-phosphatase [Nocardioides jiangxiensis]|uniref:protein-tyrosine-phosphatase n=1 Tax=Nocardioides jiangxiensis TaxID=3064524 RepID=A0ABT9B5I9_9ACTN|nr:low molecular weight protein-tyrosine-phosphatase [Nocardioides sp. WY-20]MDO7868398.1 low molecular weight protein-tyrosine-phosphatase [Nocardioides sp. WY-20]
MSLPALPAATGPGYRVAVVCLGNICRSPVADVVLNHRIAAAGLDVRVDSFGTGGWHVGEPMDRRSAATLTSAGYDPTRHRARQFVGDHASAYDLILAMDSSHHRELAALGVPAERLLMFRAFDPEGPGDVPDPYYGGPQGFDDVLAMIERTADALVEALQR